jgi:phosphoglycolate phosphatase-like HAD superfamily hydrolase
MFDMQLSHAKIPSMAEFEAGIYDFDGTLADSGSHNLKLMKEGLIAQNQERSESIILEARSLPWTECVRHLFPDATNQILERYNYDVTTRHYQLINELKIFPYVLETLESQCRKRIPLAIVSNRENSIYWMLRKKGLDDYFKVVVDRSMVSDPKPSAEPVLLAAELLGVDLHHAFGVGDSKTDIYSYQEAGIGLTIGFARGYDGKELFEANPDHIVSSYEEIDFIIAQGLRRVGDEPVVWREV